MINPNTKLNDKLFFPKETICPICQKSFIRYSLKKAQFSVSKRDMDYRPLYLGNINPRVYAISVCPHCYYAGEDKYFCPLVSEDEQRRKQFFAGHKAQWEAASRVRAAGSGQQVWKDLASEKLKEMTPEDLMILRRFTPLLQKAAGNIIAKGKPYNELLKAGDPDAVIKSYELAAICYKARRANHRILGYAYLNGAWASRDAWEGTQDEAKKEEYKAFEMAYLREAVSFLNITNMASNVEDTYLPDGTPVVKENLPQSRIFEVMYILGGANRLLGNIQESDKFLEQIMFGGSSGAQGIILWFIQQAKDLRQSESKAPKSTDNPPDADSGDVGDDGSEDE